jgi:hypothetical protein
MEQSSERKFCKENLSTRWKPANPPLRSPQIPHDLIVGSKLGRVGSRQHWPSKWKLAVFAETSENLFFFNILSDVVLNAKVIPGQKKKETQSLRHRNSVKKKEENSHSVNRKVGTEVTCLSFYDGFMRRGLWRWWPMKEGANGTSRGELLRWLHQYGRLGRPAVCLKGSIQGL